MGTTVALALMNRPVALLTSRGEKTGVNAVLGISPSTADFVKQVAVSDMFEIELSKLAAERADQATKTFAQQMVKDNLSCAFTSAPETPRCTRSLQDHCE